jgi:uncharacterized protein YkwD
MGAATLLTGCDGLGTIGLPLPAPGDDGGLSGTGSAGGNTSGLNTADPDVSDPCLQVGQPVSPVHRDMFDALNRYRSSNGLLTLSYSKVLERTANAHALDMYRRDFFDHQNPDGDGPWERAIAGGFCRAWVVGENLAWNQQSVAQAQTAWQNSPGHNANMINANYRYVGMGYYFSANGPYYVQLFGNVLPRTEEP